MLKLHDINISDYDFNKDITGEKCWFRAANGQAKPADDTIIRRGTADCTWEFAHIIDDKTGEDFYLFNDILEILFDYESKHKFTFGKYKGDYVSNHLTAEDKSYLLWADKNVEYFHLLPEEKHALKILEENTYKPIEFDEYYNPNHLDASDYGFNSF